MDWELYERYRSTLLLAGFLVVSILFVVFQKSTTVQHTRAFLVRFALPPQKFLTKGLPPVPPRMDAATGTPVNGSATLDSAAETAPLSEERRKIEVLGRENEHLREILNLKRDKWPRSIAAHVAGRDPQRWFQEIILDKGKEDGLEMDDPVLAEVNGRETLIGRLVEVSAHVSKVMLLQDSLSAVAASVEGERGEDGVVEGTNTHELLLKYLDRGSQVKIGDLVMTSGLGKAFPAGVAIGWVESLEPDPRQMFLQARLRPAARSNQLRMVLVLQMKKVNE